MEIKSKIRIIALALLTCIVFFSCAKEDKLVLLGGHEVHESTALTLENIVKTMQQDAKNDCIKMLSYEDWYYKYFDMMDKAYKKIKDDLVVIENTNNNRENFFKSTYESYKNDVKNERQSIFDANVPNQNEYLESELLEIVEKAMRAAREGVRYEEWLSQYKAPLLCQSATNGNLKEEFKKHLSDEEFDVDAFLEARIKNLYSLLSLNY